MRSVAVGEHVNMSDNTSFTDINKIHNGKLHTLSVPFDAAGHPRKNIKLLATTYYSLDDFIFAIDFLDS